MSKTNRKYFTTPTGVAKYPHLNKPDTKFNADGEYHTKLVVPNAACAELVEKLDAMHEEAYETIKKELVEGKKAAQAKSLKLADKTSNLRALASSPPSDWPPLERPCSAWRSTAGQR